MNGLIERSRCRTIKAERLFHDDARPALGIHVAHQPGTPQPLRRGRDYGGRQRQVEQPVAAGVELAVQLFELRGTFIDIAQQGVFGNLERQAPRIEPGAGEQPRQRRGEAQRLTAFLEVERLDGLSVLDPAQRRARTAVVARARGSAGAAA